MSYHAGMSSDAHREGGPTGAAAMSVPPAPDLLRGAAHLLRTPLGVVLGLAATLRDYDHRFTADQRTSYLGEIYQAAEEMRVALDGLSLLARLLSGGITVSPAAVPVGELVRDGAAALTAVWGAGSAVPVTLPTVAAAWVDAQRVRQGLEALASAFTPAAGAVLSAAADGTPSLRLGPVAPRGAGEDARAILDGPLAELDVSTLISRPGSWALLLARLLFEAQGVHLRAGAEAAVGPLSPAFTLSIHLPAPP